MTELAKVDKTDFQVWSISTSQFNGRWAAPDNHCRAVPHILWPEYMRKRWNQRYDIIAAHLATRKRGEGLFFWISYPFCVSSSSVIKIWFFFNFTKFKYSSISDIWRYCFNCNTITYDNICIIVFIEVDSWPVQRTKYNIYNKNLFQV